MFSKLRRLPILAIILVAGVIWWGAGWYGARDRAVLQHQQGLAVLNTAGVQVDAPLQGIEGWPNRLDHKIGPWRIGLGPLYLRGGSALLARLRYKAGHVVAQLAPAVDIELAGQNTQLVTERLQASWVQKGDRLVIEAMAPQLTTAKLGARRVVLRHSNSQLALDAEGVLLAGHGIDRLQLNGELLWRRDCAPCLRISGGRAQVADVVVTLSGVLQLDALGQWSGGLELSGALWPGAPLRLDGVDLQGQ